MEDGPERGRYNELAAEFHRFQTLVMIAVRSYFPALLVLVVFVASSSSQEAAAPTPADKDLGRQISRLVQQLDSDRAAERDAAEKQLVELAGANAAAADRFL